MKLLSRLALVITLTATTVVAQTKVTPPKNKYTPQQDVEIGREAAAEVRKQYPIINDSQIRAYLERLGDRLVEAAPRELNNPAFEYSFTPVNLKDINAFALPGGPMFVNRGMIEAAASEGEVAGVMAHELAHVLLRHGTANATKAQGFQIGALAGAIAGAVIGGGWGEVISQGSQFGLGTWLMKYSREYERQADIVGVQIMARAGYDPRDLAHMFETIQRQGGSGGPEWLSSHPNPGNRTQYINQEAALLRVGPRPNDSGFQQTRSRLSHARTGADDGGNRARRRGRRWRRSIGRIGRTHRRGGAAAFASVSNRSGRSVVHGERAVELAGGVVEQLDQVRPAECLRRLSGAIDSDARRRARRGARFVARSRPGDTDVIDGFVRGNDGMRVAGREEYFQLSGRKAIVTPLEGRSALGGVERVDVHTTLLSNGDLFYVLTVVPERELGTYGPAFDRVVRTVRINDR